MAEHYQQLNIGPRLEVYWPTDRNYYFGTINSIDIHGKVSIQYEYRDRETLDLSSEV